jgi:hypothetical protein
MLGERARNSSGALFAMYGMTSPQFIDANVGLGFFKKRRIALQPEPNLNPT